MGPQRVARVDAASLAQPLPKVGCPHEVDVVAIRARQGSRTSFQRVRRGSAPTQGFAQAVVGRQALGSRSIDHVINPALNEGEHGLEARQRSLLLRGVLLLEDSRGHGRLDRPQGSERQHPQVPIGSGLDRP